MHVPAALSDEEAAALPEVFLTAFLNLFMLAGVKARRSGADSRRRQRRRHGVDPVAARGGRALDRDRRATTPSASNVSRFGADVAINYNAGPFRPKVKTATNERGVDIILDSIGGAYLAQNLEALAHSGRLVLIGLMKGAKAEIDLSAVLRRHLQGDRLDAAHAPGGGEGGDRRGVPRALRRRARSRADPPADLQGAAAGRDVAEAHRMMQASEHFGKIVLRVA